MFSFDELGRSPASGMIGIHFKIGKEERFATGLGAATVWFDRHEDPVDLG
jgi:hypothetical protein